MKLSINFKLILSLFCVIVFVSSCVFAQTITTGELAERLHIRHHSAVGLIDRLASKRLIRRRAGRDDRRQVEIEPTTKAEALLAGLSAAHQDELRVLAPLLRALLADFEPS